MRQLTIGNQRHTKVLCIGEPGAGGACHEYRILSTEDREIAVRSSHFANIYFQNGPIQESGVNGCQNEDLLAILIDRLEGFQSGNFPCAENAEALFHLNETLAALNKRTEERIKRGVEDTLEK